MRAGISFAIQQTLTPEASTVLTNSIAEAGRRSHSQTTPLHVAATLLSSPSGYLRKACAKSHPNSSHPLQCRALELCFSVALERLPTTTAAADDPGPEPPMSNALATALKRAQANQRKGCPEQPPQQSLLAVKVELEQLIISILDDPSVSRVMREAKFSSPAVKATIEKSLSSELSRSGSEPRRLGNEGVKRVVDVAGRAPPIPGLFPRIGTTGFLGTSLESMSPLKAFPTVAIAPVLNRNPVGKTDFCPECKHNYEQELAKHVKKPKDANSESAQQQSLPLWLKNATTKQAGVEPLDQSLTKDHELIQQQKTMALQKKWHDTCLRLHPGHHRSNRGPDRLTISMPSLYNQRNNNLVPCVPKINLTGGYLTLEPNANPSPKQSPKLLTSPPRSPVRTELVLGNHPPKVAAESIPSSKFQINKLLDKLDADEFKKLLKGLMEKVWWQQDAASAVATVITQWKLGSEKRRGSNNVWLLFTGPDRIGKKKMAVALSELVRHSNPVTVHLGFSGREDGGFGRGKTVVDRIVEAVRRNPFSVVVLEDIDEADMVVKGTIKRAMERGRLSDSHGREISLGNVIFILTAEGLEFESSHHALDEKKLASFVGGGWQLRLSVSGKTAKRRASCCNWLDERPKKDTRSGLSFDLNEEAGSQNSSDLTVDHEDEQFLSSRLLTPTTNTSATSSSSLPLELLDLLDDSITFKPVDFGAMRRDILKSIIDRASSIIGDANNLELEPDALGKIAGGLCLGYIGLEEWTETALVPSLRQVRMKLEPGRSMVIWLEPDRDLESRSPGDWLPSSVRVMVDGR